MRTTDEQAIRRMVDTWWTASRNSDVRTVLDLMDDEVLFMVVGGEPFGKQAFRQRAESMKDVRVEGGTNILEIQIDGDQAWMRAQVTAIMTFPDGRHNERTGYVLSILRKKADGHWVIFREANLLPPMS